MKTEILLPTEENYEKCGQLIRSGQLVAFPTETVYGLGANALDLDAVGKVYAAKGRPSDNPLIVHIASPDDIGKVALYVPDKAKAVIEKFMPGSVTVVMPKRPEIPDCVTGGLNTVAVRIPSHPVALRFLQACRVPVCAPSANTSTRPSPTCAMHVYDDLNGKIAAILDGGNCDVGVESTVIDFVGARPRLLRAGGTPVEELEKVTGPICREVKSDRPLCPGMKYKHYAPKADVTLLNGTFEQFKAYVDAHMDQNPSCLCFTGEAEKLGVPCVEYGREGDGADQAKHIFRSLRALDEQGDGIVYARCPQKDGLSMAVYNRLIRAAAFRVIQL